MLRTGNISLYKPSLIPCGRSYSLGKEENLNQCQSRVCLSMKKQQRRQGACGSAPHPQGWRNWECEGLPGEITLLQSS